MIKLNVYNLKRFFEIVNHCDGPVFLDAPDGKSEDLRRNSFLQYVISSSQPKSSFTHFDVRVSDKDDIARLLQFCMGDN